MNLAGKLIAGTLLLGATTIAGGYAGKYIATPNQAEQIRAQTVLPTTRSEYEAADVELQRARIAKDVGVELYDKLVKKSENLHNKVDEFTRIAEGTPHPAGVPIGAGVGLLVPLFIYGLAKSD